MTSEIPDRELVTLLAYLETGSHKAAARRLGIREGTSRQRMMRLLARTGSSNVAQATWLLHDDLVRAAHGRETRRHGLAG